MPNGFIHNNAGINIELAISFYPVKNQHLMNAKYAHTFRLTILHIILFHVTKRNITWREYKV